MFVWLVVDADLFWKKILLADGYRLVCFESKVLLAGG
jgi:hypothetical protein